MVFAARGSEESARTRNRTRHRTASVLGVCFYKCVGLGCQPRTGHTPRGYEKNARLVRVRSWLCSTCICTTQHTWQESAATTYPKDRLTAKPGTPITPRRLRPESSGHERRLHVSGMFNNKVMSSEYTERGSCTLATMTHTTPSAQE